MRIPLIAAVLAISTSRAFGQSKFADALSGQGTHIIHDSLTGGTIRQCSCDEQKECLTEVKEQTYSCFDQCWYIVKPLTNHSIELKACFSDKEQVLNGFFSCLESNIKSCVPTQTGPQIPQADLRKIISNTEKRITAKSHDILRSLDVHGRTLLSTALEVAECIKDCVLERNNEGFCFDRKKCLPKVDSYDTEFTLKRCMRSTKWKKEAAELCACSVKAGVSYAREYCQLLSPFARTTIDRSHWGMHLGSDGRRRQ